MGDAMRRRSRPTAFECDDSGSSDRWRPERTPSPSPYRESSPSPTPPSAHGRMSLTPSPRPTWRRRREQSPTDARERWPSPLLRWSEGKVGFFAVARRTGRLAGRTRPPLPSPQLTGMEPEPSVPTRPRVSWPSPSPEPAEQPASPTRTDRRPHRDRKTKKSLYLVMPDGHGAFSGYAVHRIDLAHSRRGISTSAEELAEPPVARFQAAEGMNFVQVGSKIVGVSGKEAGADKAESVIIDAGSWEVSAGPPPFSVKYGLVEFAGKIYYMDMFTKDPKCEVLDLASADASWSPLPRPPFSGRILSLASHPSRRSLFVSTEENETYRFYGDGRGDAAWVKLPCSVPLPFDENSVYSKDHDLWFQMSQRDGRLRAHDLDVLGTEPVLECETYRLSDPIPVTTPSSRGVSGCSTKLIYLGSGKFCVVQAAAESRRAEADSVVITVTVFKVLDSKKQVKHELARGERRMNVRWVTTELQRACTEAFESGRWRRQLCRVNLWSRQYVVRGGAGRPRGPRLAAALWM